MNEIERKWLVNNVPTDIMRDIRDDKLSHSKIIQSYLEFQTKSNPREVRIRNDGGKYFHTIKIDSDNPIKRNEIDTPISVEEFSGYAEKSISNNIVKDRFVIPHGDYKIELNFFKDNLDGLIMAEVEFPTEADAMRYQSPEWFGVEVTDKEAYRNANLSRYGIPKENKTYKIVLTGGPCGGKSTFAVECVNELEAKGFKVFVVSEVATEVMQRGIKPWDLDAISFQSIVTEEMLINEKGTLRAAEHFNKKGQDVVIIYDRGIMDNRAYCTAEQWEEVKKGYDLSDQGILSGYDAVLNIVTTAYGAEAVWNKQSGNNVSRYETSIEQARETENKTQKVWVGHPNFIIAGNEGGWDAKVQVLLNAIYGVIGIQPHQRVDEKYLVEFDRNIDLEMFAKQMNANMQEIEQTYLLPFDVGERRVRRVKNMGDDGMSHSYTEYLKTGGDRTVRRETMISQKDYSSRLIEADPNKKPIHKIRGNFTFNNQGFALDDFGSQMDGLLLLERKNIMAGGKATELILPPGLRLLDDVTNDRNYLNSSLADKN